MDVISLMENVFASIWEWLKTHQKKINKVFGYITLFLILGFYGWQIYVNGFNFNWQDYRFSFKHIVAVLIMHAIGLVYGSLGWATIMNIVGQRKDIFKSIKIYYLTLITRNLPGLLLHSMSRAYLHQEEGRGKTLTIVAVLVELLITVLSGVIIYLSITYFYTRDPIIPVYYAWGILLLGFLVLYPPIFKKLVRRVPGYANQEAIAADLSIKHIVYLLMLYVLIILLAGVMLFYTINILYFVPVSQLGLVVAAFAISMSVMALIFWMPGSVRIRDATLLVILSSLTSPDVALLITLLWRYLLLFSDFSWGVLLLGGMWWQGDGLWQELKSIVAVPLSESRWNFFKKKKSTPIPRETQEHAEN